jgi:Putative transposase
VQPPLSAQQGPEAVLKYLARYVAGAAISDSRLLSHSQGRVAFRAKNYRQGRRRETLSLPEQEFVRRFLLHVLPRGFVRVRYYGLLANTQRATMIARCRELLGAATTDVAAPANPNANECASDPAVEPPPCPACGRGRLLLIDSQPRPAWCDVGGLPCPASTRFLSTRAPHGDSS